MLRPIAAALGWSAAPAEVPDTGTLRNVVLAFLGEVGDPGVVAEAQRRFTRFLADPASLAPNDRQTVFDVVGMNADAATFARLRAFADHTTSDGDRNEAFAALAHNRNDALAAAALQIAMSKEIPPQDAFAPLNMAAAAGDFHAVRAWRFYRRHANELLAPVGPMSVLFSLNIVSQGFWRGAAEPEIEAWLRARAPPAMSAALADTLERVRVFARQQTRIVASTDAALRG